DSAALRRRCSVFVRREDPGVRIQQLQRDHSLTGPVGVIEEEAPSQRLSRLDPDAAHTHRARARSRPDIEIRSASVFLDRLELGDPERCPRMGTRIAYIAAAALVFWNGDGDVG